MQTPSRSDLCSLVLTPEVPRYRNSHDSVDDDAAPEDGLTLVHLAVLHGQLPMVHTAADAHTEHSAVAVGCGLWAVAAFGSYPKPTA